LKTLDRSRRLARASVLTLVAVLAVPAFSRTFHSDAWARDKFAAAERMREALNGRPAGERSRRDYQKTIDAYRRVYLGAPASTKADPSVVATAELMVEMGRRFDDAKILRGAIKQYEFLRREYPGSKYRVEALFTIGEIYKDDLENSQKARDAFQLFLKKYPHSHSADDARTAIADLNQPKTKSNARVADAKSPDVKADTKPAEIKKDKSADAQNAPDSDASASMPGNKIARVTSIRHWSTADYTRVAIDLEQDVKFDSERIDNPDRIFFDLYGTQLASTLVGKSFDVQDGFLKKIRVAQFKPGKTRIVLEVDDLPEYNAFLLPNPTRLIIDIHGKKTDGAEQASKKRTADDNDELEAKTDAAAASPKVARGDARADGKPASIAENKVPIRIVEADDDDDNAPSKPAKSPGKTPNAAARKPSREGDAPVPRRVKRKSADGNNDEVATLDPVDSSPEPPPVPSVNSKAVSKTVRGTKRSSRQTPAELQVREAQPTARGDRSLIRALGLKIGKIVIDPGHGGHDTGTIGPNGLEEKDLVLDVSRRLGKLLEGRLGADVIFTRQEDTFIPLETRTAIANQEQADLFVSVHANSSRDPDARGVETYYLNFTSNADALEVAARENAVSDKSIHELQDLVKKIALKEKIEESREFASDVQRSLHTGLAVKSPGIRDRGVKKAPFIVLIGANMPSILAEISFVSNPTDERKLETPEYRQRIAESLYKGISKYVSGLSGVKVASRITKDEGQ